MGGEGGSRCRTKEGAGKGLEHSKGRNPIRALRERKEKKKKKEKRIHKKGVVMSSKQESQEDRLQKLQIDAEWGPHSAQRPWSHHRNPVRPLRKLEMVMKYAPQILRSPADFDLKEQLCVAALDCVDALRRSTLQILAKSFSSDSTRVRILVVGAPRRPRLVDKAKTL